MCRCDLGPAVNAATIWWIRLPSKASLLLFGAREEKYCSMKMYYDANWVSEELKNDHEFVPQALSGFAQRFLDSDN